MNGLLLQLRVSILWLVSAALSALAISIVVLRTTTWIGFWPATGAAAQIPAYFLSALAAGAAAWIASSKSRHQLTEQYSASAISPIRAEACRFVACLVPLLVPYFLGVVLTFILTARTFPPGINFWATYALMGALTMILGIGVGWLAGTLTESIYSPVIAALGWLAFATFIGDPVALTVVSGPSWLEANPISLFMRFAAAIVLVLAAIVQGAHLARPKAAFLRLGVPAVALAIVVVAITNTSGIRNRSPMDHPFCAETAIVTCWWPEDREYVSMAASFDANIRSLPPQFKLPARLYEYGLQRDPVGGLAGDLLVTGGSRSSLGQIFAQAIVTNSLKSCDSDALLAATEDQSPDALTKWVELYINGSTVQDYTTSGVPQGIQKAWDEAVRVHELEPEQQRKWVEQKFINLRKYNC